VRYPRPKQEEREEREEREDFFFMKCETKSACPRMFLNEQRKELTFFPFLYFKCDPEPT
jgi:hypothetical protein